MGERRAAKSHWGLVFYKHFTATRFFRQTPERAQLILWFVTWGSRPRLYTDVRSAD